MRDSQEKIQQFCNHLAAHAAGKSTLYDGVEPLQDFSLDGRLRLATEELGEIASAITRGRLALAKEECFDLAHCALLIYLALDDVGRAT